MECVRVESEGGITRITLNRPDVRNAFNEVLVTELREAFANLGAETRVVILGGAGKSFCAGADLTWMQKAVALGGEQNAQDAAAMVELFNTIDACPKVVIGRIHGAAVGGGLGLLSCCDIAVATHGVSFGFSEVRLGVVPAVISPYVLRKIPVSAARRYFVTGERFDAQAAKTLGLVHEVVGEAELDATVDAMASQILSTGPNAVAEAKALIRTVAPPVSQEVHDYTVQLIARLRVAPEAQEGFAAFLEKRAPQWPDTP